MERFIYTSKFLKAVERGQIERVIIYGIFLGYKLKDRPQRFFTHRSMLTDENLLSLFKQNNIKFTTFPVEDKTIATILFGVVSFTFNTNPAYLLLKLMNYYFRYFQWPCGFML